MYLWNTESESVQWVAAEKSTNTTKILLTEIFILLHRLLFAYLSKLEPISADITLHANLLKESTPLSLVLLLALGNCTLPSQYLGLLVEGK